MCPILVTCETRESRQLSLGLDLTTEILFSEQSHKAIVKSKDCNCDCHLGKIWAHVDLHGMLFGPVVLVKDVEK